jgi:peptidoglycan lytic transglycosylase G
MFRKIVKAGFALASIALLALFVWLAVSLYRPRAFTPGDVFVEVKKGMGIGAMARLLEESGVIRSRHSFIICYRLFYYPRTIRAGEYALRSPLEAKEVLDILVKGKVFLHSVTIPEGLTALEIAPLISPYLADGQEGFMDAFHDAGMISPLDGEAEDLEGYLFPETYSIPKGISSAEAVGAMVSQFRAAFSGGWPARAQSLGMSTRQVVTLASLIEKETSVAEEMKLVSAVFHNRLRIGMKLDCDPTIIYALKQKGLFNGNLTKKDMSLDSLYNTYRHRGLPPGPICNPGRAALEAALYPADEAYLYFVSRNDGSHHFSRTFAEHQNAVRLLQKKR